MFKSWSSCDFIGLSGDRVSIFHFIFSQLCDTYDNRKHQLFSVSLPSVITVLLCIVNYLPLCVISAQELVAMVQANQVLVVSGETGCGKTTQVGIKIVVVLDIRLCVLLLEYR